MITAKSELTWFIVFVVLTIMMFVCGVGVILDNGLLVIAIMDFLIGIWDLVMAIVHWKSYRDYKRYENNIKNI